jgi:hypothetical protein
MKKIGIFLVLVALNNSVFAGMFGLTHHSRANCVNNESISWYKGHNYWFWVNSEHYNKYTNQRLHYELTGWQFTWRAAAVHWGEASDPIPGNIYPAPWRVHGTHWMLDSANRPHPTAEEWVDDCSIYDGWWG